MSLVVWVIALIVTVGAAAIQGTVGVGYGMVAVPLLALLNPALAPVPQLLSVIPLTVAMVWRERDDVDMQGVGWLVVGRVPGAIIGVGLLAIATQRTLDIFIGVVVLAAVAIVGSGFHIVRTGTTQFGAGVASGTTSLVASIGGPPTALLYTTAEAATIRSTLAAVFAVGVTFTAGVRAVTGNISSSDVRISLVLIPAVMLGWYLSTRYKDRFTQSGVRTGVLVASGAAAVGLIIRAITS